MEFLDHHFYVFKSLIRDKWLPLFIHSVYIINLRLIPFTSGVNICDVALCEIRSTGMKGK